MSSGLSILNSVKGAIGLEVDQDEFDSDLVMFINARFRDLKQIGVPISNSFILTGADDTWENAVPDENYYYIMEYVTLKTRLRFDPPISSGLMTALNEAVKECEWRLNHEYDLG